MLTQAGSKYHGGRPDTLKPGTVARGTLVKTLC